MARPRLSECACDFCAFFNRECCLSPVRSCEFFQPGPGWGRYLSRAHWRTIRVKKLISVGEKCEICGADQSLNVHHNDYSNLFDEDLADLQVLCVKCHARIRMESYRQRRWMRDDL